MSITEKRDRSESPEDTGRSILLPEDKQLKRGRTSQPLRRGTPASAQAALALGAAPVRPSAAPSTAGIAAADTGWTMPPGSCARRSWYCALAQCSTHWALARSMLPCGWDVPSSTPLSGLLEASAALQRLWRRRRSPAQHRWPKTCLAHRAVCKGHRVPSHPCPPHPQGAGLRCSI